MPVLRIQPVPYEPARMIAVDPAVTKESFIARTPENKAEFNPPCYTETDVLPPPPPPCYTETDVLPPPPPLPD